MLSRNELTQRALDTLSRLFDMWRRVLTRALSSISRWVRHGLDASGTVVKSIATLIRRASLDSAAFRRLVLFAGPIALMTGVLLSLALKTLDSGLLGLLMAFILAIGWAIARLIVMHLSAGETRSVRDDLSVAWAYGLLPYLFALTQLLKLVAWLVSIVLISRALGLLGWSPAPARRTVQWVLVFELTAVFAYWLAQNLTVLAIILGT